MPVVGRVRMGTPLDVRLNEFLAALPSASSSSSSSSSIARFRGGILCTRGSSLGRRRDSSRTGERDKKDDDACFL